MLAASPQVVSPELRRLRGLCIGGGYFAQFHLDAWRRMADVEIIGLCDRDADQAREATERFGIQNVCCDPREAAAWWQFDFVDIITPPASHAELIELFASPDHAIICQKPFAGDLDAARRLVALAEQRQCRLMIHENFRFQPWHREIGRLLREDPRFSQRVHSLTFRTRLGDGWGPDAYRHRQPYFRDMPRFLLHETGVHFVDTFRFLAGEVTRVTAITRRLNPDIAGEDAGLLILELATGAVGLWDANRYNESASRDPRFTFGEFSVETSGGTIRLDADGRLTVQPLGEPESPHSYPLSRLGFAGDCVHATQRHFVECLRRSEPFETSGRDYLRNIEIIAAAYQSANEGRAIAVPAT